MFDGLQERLNSEVIKKYPNTRIIASKDRKFCVWKGASVYASLSTYNPMSKKDYEEYGATYIHKK